MSMAGLLGDVKLKVTLICLPTHFSFCCSTTHYLSFASRLTQITLSAMLQMASIIVQSGEQLLSVLPYGEPSLSNMLLSI